MPSPRKPFPTTARMRDALLQLSIFRALSNAKEYGPPHPQDDPITWEIRDVEHSAYGCIKDDGTRVMGYVFAFQSRRNPFRRRGFNGPVEPYQYLAGMPAEFRAMVDEREVRRNRESNGDRSIITAAFWSEGDHLTAAEPWSAVLRASGNAITFLMDITEPPSTWLGGDSPIETELAHDIYRRKVALGPDPLILTDEDTQRIHQAVAPAWERRRQIFRRLHSQDGSSIPIDLRLQAHEQTWLRLDGARQELAKAGIILP